jgi:hypothetical protein
LADDAPITIYVPLADRAGEWRPAKAIRQREDIYCILGPTAEGEVWKFPPGSMVRRRSKILPNGKQEMVAVEA